MSTEAKQEQKQETVEAKQEQKKETVKIPEIEVLKNSFIEAVKNNKTDEVAGFLKSLKDFSNNDMYQELFFQACMNGNLDICKTFIETKKISFVDKNKYCWTPLLVAVIEGHLELVKHFVENCGVDVNEAFSVGKNTALHRATVEGHHEIVEYLLKKGASVEAKNLLEHIPLYGTIFSKNKNTIKLLLDRGADINYIYTVSTTSKKEFKTSLLLQMIIQNKLEIVEFLLNKGALINQVVEGLTPLNIALEIGKLEMVKFLLDRGASVKYIDINSMSVFQDAVKKGNLDIVRLIVERGCANISSNFGSLTHSASNGRFELVKYLIENKFYYDYEITNAYNNATTQEIRDYLKPFLPPPVPLVSIVCGTNNTIGC